MEKTFELSDDIVGVIFKSQIKETDLEKLQDLLIEKINRYGEVSVFIEDQFGDAISLKALIKDLIFEFTNRAKIKKIGLVTDAKWFRKTAEVKSFFTGANVETYRLKNRLEAIQWVSH